MWLAGGVVSVIPAIAGVYCYQNAFFNLSEKEKFIKNVEGLPFRELEGDEIGNPMRLWLATQGIQSRLHVCENYETSSAVSLGSNFNHRDCAIFIAPGLKEADSDAWHWLMKHEVSMIKQNSAVWTYGVTTICAIAAAILGLSLMPVLGAIGLSVAVSIIALSLMKDWHTNRALDFANKEGTPSELIGAKRFYVALQEHTQAPYGREIRIITEAMQKRGIVEKDFEDAKALESLKEYFKSFEERKKKDIEEYRATLKCSIPPTPKPELYRT